MTPDQAAAIDTSHMTRILPSQPLPSEVENLLPRRSSIQVCSLPYLPGTFPSTNNIVDYTLGGKVPQYRAPLPAQAPAQGAGTSTTAVVSTTSSSSSTNNPPKSQTATITSASLNPGDTFTGQVIMAKSCLFQNVTVSSAARIRLYSTSASQISDLTRPLTQAPGLGTIQGLISDAQVDAAPFILQYDQTVGSNNDTPQSNVIYITFDNLGTLSAAITATISYVPMQS